MTYRNTLIERSRQFESEHEDPVVLDYLQLRNRQCLNAWRMKRVQYALHDRFSPAHAQASQSDSAVSAGAAP
ncbi:MAG TPA: hypothetical protein VGG49_09050 [Steroidobacteraceae bacterium]|jgi:hypothetical protein